MKKSYLHKGKIIKPFDGQYYKIKYKDGNKDTGKKNPDIWYGVKKYKNLAN